MTALIVSFSNGHKTIEFAASQHAKKSSSMSIIFSGFYCAYYSCYIKKSFWCIWNNESSFDKRGRQVIPFISLPTIFYNNFWNVTQHNITVLEKQNLFKEANHV